MNRSAPLQRSAPLKRRKRMKRGPCKRSLNRTLAAALYLRWLHGRPCCVRGSASPCEGDIQQSHARNIGPLPTGMGRKEDDFQSVPMCKSHHLEHWEAHAGVFAGWSRELRRAWIVAAIAAEHCEFQLEGGLIP